MNILLKIFEKMCENKNWKLKYNETNKLIHLEDIEIFEKP